MLSKKCVCCFFLLFCLFFNWHFPKLIWIFDVVTYLVFCFSFFSNVFFSFFRSFSFISFDTDSTIWFFLFLTPSHPTLFWASVSYSISFRRSNKCKYLLLLCVLFFSIYQISVCLKRPRARELHYASLYFWAVFIKTFWYMQYAHTTHVVDVVLVVAHFTFIFLSVTVITHSSFPPYISNLLRCYFDLLLFFFSFLQHFLCIILCVIRVHRMRLRHLAPVLKKKSQFFSSLSRI